MGEDAIFEVRNAEIEELLRGVAKRIGHDMPQGFGFTLLIFSYGEQGSMFYISTAQRADMLNAMKEFIRKQENL